MHLLTRLILRILVLEPFLEPELLKISANFGSSLFSENRLNKSCSFRNRFLVVIGLWKFLPLELFYPPRGDNTVDNLAVLPPGDTPRLKGTALQLTFLTALLLQWTDFLPVIHTQDSPKIPSVLCVSCQINSRTVRTQFASSSLFIALHSSDT